MNAGYLTPGLDANLAMTQGENTYYYMQDGLGSVRNVVESDEDVANTYNYRAFGINHGNSEGVTSPYRFTAREFETGGVLNLHYYRNRSYAGALGIFTSRDAMWADIHRGWRYVGNNPIAFSDPYGFMLGGPKTIIGFAEFSAGFLLLGVPGGQGPGVVLMLGGVGMTAWDISDIPGDSQDYADRVFANIDPEGGDSDSDGYPDQFDPSPDDFFFPTGNWDPNDIDSDGIPNEMDCDIDGDGAPNGFDPDPHDPRRINPRIPPKHPWERKSRYPWRRW